MQVDAEVQVAQPEGQGRQTTLTESMYWLDWHAHTVEVVTLRMKLDRQLRQLTLAGVGVGEYWQLRQVVGHIMQVPVGDVY